MEAIFRPRLKKLGERGLAMATYDLLVRGGTVVDGTGSAPRRTDVAVRDGRVAAVGRIDASDATEVFDADGLIVAPGVVDVHTHYDPQMTFEPLATMSSYHGVTTVLAGNCGFSIAPTAPATATSSPRCSPRSNRCIRPR